MDPKNRKGVIDGGPFSGCDQGRWLNDEDCFSEPSSRCGVCPFPDPADARFDPIGPSVGRGPDPENPAYDPDLLRQFLDPSGLEDICPDSQGSQTAIQNLRISVFRHDNQIRTQ
jgi:hypothetical protein